MALLEGRLLPLFGMGLPVGKHIVPDKPVPVNDELVWNNGTPYPEPCIDRIADTVDKTPQVYPCDNLRGTWQRTIDCGASNICLLLFRIVLFFRSFVFILESRAVRNNVQ